MDNLIEELVEEIKKDPRYITFIEEEKNLLKNPIQELLQNYQTLNTEYQEVKKYQKYIDISEIEETLKATKQEISKNPSIQKYYQSYHAINDLLDVVTMEIFDGISEEIDTSRYTI